MVLVRKGEQERFIAGLAQANDLLGVLVFGNDAGGVREAARRIARAILGTQADDPLCLVQLGEDDLKDDPGRLLDEMQSIAMFGGRRVIRVRDAGAAFRAAMKPVLALERAEAVVVAEAPGLKKDAALARLFEKEERLAALPVHADDAGDLNHLIDTVMAAHGLAVERDARQALMALLGADRLASRNELEKLALYCRGQDRVRLADVQAVCSDVSAHMMSDMLDAFFTGRMKEGVRLFTALLAEGTPAAAMLQAAANHVARLKDLAGAVAQGASVEQVVRRARPPIFFRRQPLVERQLRIWNLAALARADESIWQAMRQARQLPEMQNPLAERCFMALAMQATRRRAA